MAETDADTIAEALLAEFIELRLTRLFGVVPNAHDDIARYGFHQRLAHLHIAVASRNQLVVIHNRLHAKRFHKLYIVIDFIQKLLEGMAVFTGIAILPFAEDEFIHADMEMFRFKQLDRLTDGQIRQLPPQRFGKAYRVVPRGVMLARIARHGGDVRHIFRMGTQPLLMADDLQMRNDFDEIRLCPRLNFLDGFARQLLLLLREWIVLKRDIGAETRLHHIQFQRSERINQLAVRIHFRVLHRADVQKRATVFQIRPIFNMAERNKRLDVVRHQVDKRLRSIEQALQRPRLDGYTICRHIQRIALL